MTLKIRPVIEAQILLRYSAIRSDALSGVPITVLHIGPEQTVIATAQTAKRARSLRSKSALRKRQPTISSTS